MSRTQSILAWLRNQSSDKSPQDGMAQKFLTAAPDKIQQFDEGTSASPGRSRGHSRPRYLHAGCGRKRLEPPSHPF